MTEGDEAERRTFASSGQRRDLDRIGGMGSPLRQDTGDFEIDLDLDESLDGSRDGGGRGFRPGHSTATAFGVAPTNRVEELLGELEKSTAPESKLTPEMRHKLPTALQDMFVFYSMLGGDRGALSGMGARSKTMDQGEFKQLLIDLDLYPSKKRLPAVRVGSAEARALREIKWSLLL